MIPNPIPTITMLCQSKCNLFPIQRQASVHVHSFILFFLTSVKLLSLFKIWIPNHYIKTVCMIGKLMFWVFRKCRHTLRLNGSHYKMLSSRRGVVSWSSSVLRLVFHVPETLPDTLSRLPQHCHNIITVGHRTIPLKQANFELALGSP